MKKSKMLAVLVAVFAGFILCALAQTQQIATATPTLVNGFIVAITVTDGGAGYTNAPALTISGGGGSGAVATATVSAGKVTHIDVIDAGRGYTYTPNVRIGPPAAMPASFYYQLQPDRHCVAGTPITLYAEGQGTPPLLYQWFKGNVEIPNGNRQSLVFTNTQVGDAGIYSVVVSNQWGSSMSSIENLTIVPFSLPAVIAGPITNPITKRRFYLLEKSSWPEAESAAVLMGGHLATVRNQDDEDWIFSTFARLGQFRNLWIGLHDPDPVYSSTISEERKSEFVWSSGDPVSYSNWSNEEPSNAWGTGEYYVYITNPNSGSIPNPTGKERVGKWNDYDFWGDNTDWGAPINGVVELSSSSPKPPFSDGLVAYYPFNGNANDESGSGLNLVNSNITFTTITAQDQCALFDRTNSGASGDYIFFAGKTNWTYSVWLMPSKFVNHSNDYCLYSEGSDCVFNISLPNSAPQDGTVIDRVVLSALNAETGESISSSFMASISISCWNHLVFTFSDAGPDNGDLLFFLNGSFVAATNFQAATYRTNNSPIPKMSVGAKVDDAIGGYEYHGFMDNIRIYSRAISSNEVVLLHAFEFSILSNSPPFLPAQVASTSYDGFLYELWYGPGITWSAAESNAVSRGGTLAVFTTSDQTKYVYNNLIGNGFFQPTGASWTEAWLGAHPAVPDANGGTTSTTNWAWVDGESWTTFDSLNFDSAQEEPDEPNGDINSALAINRYGNSHWNDEGSAWFVGGYIVQRNLVATATIRVENGSIVAATLINGGNCYTNAPSVRIIGDGYGAQVVAVVSNGVVTAINVLAAGVGYTNTPILVIAPPFIPQPTISASSLSFGPFVTPLLELNLSNLSPYNKYQLQFSPVAGGTWTNFGTPFSPTANTSTQYVNANGNVGFFRLSEAQQ